MGELLRQGLRDLNSGIDTFSQARKAAGVRQDRLDLQEGEKEKARILKERIGGASDAVSSAVDLAQDPNSTRADFEASVADAKRTSAVESNPFIERQIGRGRDIFAAREADEKNKMSEEVTNKKNKSKDAKLEKKEAREVSKFTETMAKNFRQDQTTKKTREIGDSFTGIKKLFTGTPTGAKDHAGIFKTLKGVDPGSTIREGEFDTVKKLKSFFADNVTTNDRGDPVIKGRGTGGIDIPVPSFLLTLVQKIDPQARGAFLLPQQREDLIASSKLNFRSALERQVAIDEGFRKRAEAAGIDPDLVIDRGAQSQLDDLDAAQAEREAARKDAAPEISVAGEEGKDGGESNKPSLKAVDSAGIQRLMDNPNNQQVVNQRIEQVNQKRLAEGKEPLTEEQENQAAMRILENAGFRPAGQ